jgi:tetratricopeptide (TPR) repeat protein
VWTRCREIFGITDVELLTSAAVSSPVTLGAFRAAVIVPEHFLTETSEEVLSAALGHELAHIRRRDFGLNLLYELLYIPVSFHPASWLIRRELERTREMACDEAVTSRLLEPRVYAQSIVKIAAGITRPSQPGYTLGVFDGNTLELRIRRLLERPGANLKRARLLLAGALSALVVCVITASSLALTARPQSAFDTQMKLAGDAYNGEDFKLAVEHFSTAVSLQPSNIGAKLFLANALMRYFYTQRQPDSRLLSGAVQLYQEVLARDRENRQATAGMTAIAVDNQQFQEAREWAQKLAAIDPNDKTAWYTLGLLNWAIVFPEFQRAKEAAGGKQEEYFIRDSSLRVKLRTLYLPQVEEGARMLEKALLLDPDYEQAMAYMNLLDRLKAGMVDDPAESADLIRKADVWVRRALETKKRNAMRAGPAEEQLNVDGPPPGPAGRQTMVRAAPPPPPPPPPPPKRQ